MQIIIGKDYPDVVVPLIEAAKTNLDILMYHWGYYSGLADSGIQKLNLAIKSAIIRGVTTRALLEIGSGADNLRTRNSETLNHLKSWGAGVKFHSSPGRLHSKLLLIDKTIAVVGSHNFSRRSMSSNIETSITIEGSGNIRRLTEYFDLLWRQN